MTLEEHDWGVNRGNSIIAGVVLIGILGSLSIALQATAPSVQTSIASSVVPKAQVVGQVAAVSTTENKDSAVEIVCIPGYKYTTYNKKLTSGKTDIVVECEQIKQCSSGFSDTIGATEEKYKAGGATARCIQQVKGGILNEKVAGSDPACKAPGKGERQCPNLEHCLATDSSGKPTKCVSLDNESIPNGRGFIPANNDHFAMKQTIQDAAEGSESAQKILNQLEQDPGFAQGLRSAYAEQVAEQSGLVNDLAGQVQSSCAGGVSEADCIAATNAMKADLEEQKRKLAEMQAMQGRLASSQTGEVGPNGNKNNNNGNGNNGNNGNNNNGNNGTQPPASGQRPTGSTFPPQQQQPQQQQQQQNPNNNPYQQCYPQYYCMNNSLYWGSPQQQQNSNYNYNYGYSGQQQCQNQFVQACQYGCAQPQGTQYSTQCAQNPQQQNPAAPVASLSCGGESALFDVGMSVPISFSCTNSVSSTGSGFSTNGVVPTGTASATIQKPPAGADVVSYGLTCTASNNQTASKRCDVKINVTSIIMVANPRQVAANASSTIGWVSKGMKTCVISSPDAEEGSALEEFNNDNADITNVSGVAVTPPLTDDTTFKLSCVTKADQPKSSTITVKVGN